jgi:phage N-6-adenine-methyltransferase
MRPAPCYTDGKRHKPNALMPKSRKGERLNTDVMFSSATDLWSTPQEYFDSVSKEFQFTLDVCALPENTKCQKFFSPEDDGLLQQWEGVCWMNPPYGRVIGKWVKKAYESAKAGAVVVGLLPARTDTKWFHDYIYGKSEIRFIRGRLKFGSCVNSAPFPSMLVIWKNQDV